MVIDLHAQNQVNICKGLGKKSGKLFDCWDLLSFKASNFAKNQWKLKPDLSIRGGHKNMVHVIRCVYDPVSPFNPLPILGSSNSAVLRTKSITKKQMNQCIAEI